MKKNQPLNIQRRQLLAQLPHYVAAGAATYIGLNGGLGAQIAGASEQSLTLVRPYYFAHVQYGMALCKKSGVNLERS